MLILRILAAVISHVSAILILDPTFLVVAVKILDIQRVASLVVA